jgi:hypothetical protein
MVWSLSKLCLGKHAIESEAYGTLSSGYRKIVELGRNLFNSSNEFNLSAALGTWDSILFE